jgi:hypothetical protein
MGAAMFAASAANDKPFLGAAMAGIMVLYAALLLVGGRSQTVRVLRGQKDDERVALVDLRANAFAGYVLVSAVLIGFLQALVRDVDPFPYSLLGAIGGVSYLIGLAWFRWRG